MNFGSDTAKQDLVLIIAGAVALLLFFWLYSDFHPLPAADNSLGNSAARELAAKFAMEFGYESESPPFTRFQTNTELLDSLQKQTAFKDFYADSVNRSLFPAFYWIAYLKMQNHSKAEEEFSLDIGDESTDAVAVELSESGKLIALHNNENILPTPVFRPDVLNYGIQGDSLNVYSFSNDSIFTRSLEFRFNNGTEQNTSRTRLQRNQVNYLGQSVAERMAHFYLQRSAWGDKDFEIISTERVPINDVEGATVRFERSASDVRQLIQVDVRILPSGGLLSMEYNHPNPTGDENLFSTIKEGVRAIVLLIGSFWIIVLLFLRFRMRLIDIKAATLLAVLAGLIFPFVVTLWMVYDHLNSFGTVNVEFVVLLLIVIGFTAAIATLGFFAVTAIADSITRQYWIEKLRTIDVLRVGYFNNIPVGLTLIRGISFGFLLALVWCLILFLIPGSYITLEPNFEADTTFLPYFSELLGNFFFYLLIAEVIFLVFVGQLRSSFKSVFAAVLVPSLLFIIVYPFPFDVGGFTTELVTAGVIGLLLGIIYYREDFLTTFIALFVFVSLLSTANGWLIENSPDASVFYSLIFLIIAGFISGGYSIYKGSSVRDLPKFVPDYIEELAQEDRIRQELKIARNVQQSFLPLRTPSIEGYEIAAICKPAYETGGDYYDFISLSNDRLAVTIGDVSGKGIQAAFFMTFTKGVLHALCSDFNSTIDILSKTNTMFRNNANRGTFISLIFGILDTNQNLFSFSRAGHNPVLFFNNKEGSLHEYQPEGIAIGMANDEMFKKNISEENIKLHKDDILILFTDGVVESISKTNKLYGDQRLHDLLKKNYMLSAKELLNIVEEDLENFGEKSTQHDDLTMIIIKKK
ncbi:PP2C family protein-serine/threonine phosphatase [Rhodohalobacter sp. 614A]|uniref:PP2C family protein-serine/threonine phosphatase n=1 Tax=Rhodohalobacter sp. 614A TaxID=2908649 RepID=UPI001F36E10D|nr:SpoIIE family protein phosphatase [Rhodohalobacter sp. 614A]